MDDLSTNDYNLNNLTRITAKRYGFDLFTTPRYRWKFTDIAFEEMTALLVRECAKGIGTFVDVGAHHGFYDVLVGTSNPSCALLAFEPVPENCAILGKNLELNGVEASVCQCAVSNQPGRLAFQVSEETSQSGFVANPDAGVLKSIEVDVVQLDQYLDRITDAALMVKIDTEGNEVKVLEGMRRIIGKHDDLRLVVEVNPRCLEANGESPQALLDIVDQLGFEVFVIDDIAMRYVKYHPGSDWEGYMGDRTYRNIYCLKKDRSLNLCFFSHSAGLYGAERSLLELVDSLTANYGSVCTVVLPREGPLRGMLEDRGAATLVVNYHWWCSETLPAVSEVDAVMQASCENVGRCLPTVERLSPDVIVTNTLVIPWGAVAALWLDRPHVWLVREFGQLDHGLAFYFTFQKTLEIIQEASDHIVANSEAVKDTLFNQVDSERCTVAYPNNISLAEPVKTGRSYFEYPESTKLIISGPVMRSKGQDDAIRAVKKLVQSGRDVELCVIGPADSAFGDGLKTLVQTEGLGDRIHFLGFVVNVRQVIEQADIGLVCSRHEAFGRVTAEAMLLGRPVIGTNTGGTVELVDDGENGLLYSPGDVGQLAERMTFLVDHPEKIRELGEQARKDIARKLAERPLDALAFQICRANKGKRNPNSPQLLRLVLGWEQGIQARLEEHLLQARTRLGANEVELQSARERSDVLLLEKEQAVQALTAQVAEREQQAQALSAQVAEREQAAQALTAQLAEREQAVQTLSAQVAERDERASILQNDISSLTSTLEGIHSSRLWRLLTPLRWFSRQLRRARRLASALPVMISERGGLLPFIRIVVRVWRRNGIASVNSLAHQHVRRIVDAHAGHTAAPAAVQADRDGALDLQPPEVLFVSHDASRTGAPMFLLEVIRFLVQRQGISCTILLRSGGELEDKFRELGTTAVLSNRSSLDPLVLNTLKRRNIRLIYSNTITNGLIHKRLAELGCPILCHVHEMGFSIESSFGQENLMRVLETTSMYLAGSKAVVQYLVGQKKLPPDKVALAYPFIDTKENSRIVEGQRPPLTLPEDAIVIGACGTIGWRKGTDLFIQLAQQVISRTTRPVVFVWLGGPISYGDDAYFMYDALMVGVEAQVIFPGKVEAHLPYFAQFDIFVLPSREDPFPLVMLDAASLGMPVVCFDRAGGAPEFVEDDAGIVVPYLNVQGMADAVVELVNNPGLRRRMGERAREKVAQRHDISVGGEVVANIVRRYL